MDLDLIKRLLKIVDSSNITEFSYEEGDMKIKLSKQSPQALMPAAAYIQPAASQPAQPLQTSAEAEAKAIEEALPQNLHQICSPIVGTLYRAASPDAESFVKVGDTVSPGTVLCIVEAMKLMNEIESDVSGKIVRILVENGKPVEYNQPLFLIET